MLSSPPFQVSLSVAPGDPRAGRPVRLGDRVIIVGSAATPRLAAPAARRLRTDQRRHVETLRKVAGILLNELGYLNVEERTWSSGFVRDCDLPGDRR